MPVPQKVDFIVERAGEPVHKRLIDNCATSQMNGMSIQKLEILLKFTKIS